MVIYCNGEGCIYWMQCYSITRKKNRLSIKQKPSVKGRAFWGKKNLMRTMRARNKERRGYIKTPFVFLAPGERLRD